MSQDVRHVIGCMSGTSLDGLDCALLRIEGRGLAMRGVFVRGVSRAFPVDVSRGLRGMADQTPMSSGAMAGAIDGLTRLHASVIGELAGSERVDVVCVHGQTVYHKPPVSWQAFNGSLLAGLLRGAGGGGGVGVHGAKVVWDLRQADLASGGQGAPITPLADWVLFRDMKGVERRVIVNLGGFCNVTVLGAGGGPTEVRGGDVCVCNNLLDAIARRVMGVAFDVDGRAAESAEPDDDATDDLLGMLAAQEVAGRSLGTGDEISAWIGRHWKGGAGLSGATLAASACEGIGRTIASRVASSGEVPTRLVLAGGGVRNRALRRAIEGWSSAKVVTTMEVAGIGVEYREAACFAVLGALCEDRVPITLAGVTGGREGVISGVWAG
jgi:1,6-anhydro-N-acetylmuramate kinase